MLLHGHFRTLIGYWISRGRPALHIEDVLMKHTATPLPPNAETPASVVSSDKGATPQPHNPWLAVAAHAAVHPDEHLTKARPGYTPSIALGLTSYADDPHAHVCRFDFWNRAARCFQIEPGGDRGHGRHDLYSSRPPLLRHVSHIETHAQAAGMTLDTIGWDKDTGDWDRSVLGFDKAWEDAKKDA